LDEDAPRRPSGYTENFLEKIINQPSTNSSDTPIQSKPMNRLQTLQAKRMSMIQAKLSIGEPNDKYEKEADDTASKVVQQINSPTQDKPVQKQESMEEDEELQMKSLVQRRGNLDGGEASTDLESSIQSARGSGQSLDSNLQSKMGRAMGADFSGVKVHTDSQSDQLNKSIQAKAFTTGQDVFFRQGAYDPSSKGGQELIAHELTHVVQQNAGTIQMKPISTIQRKDIGGVDVRVDRAGYPLFSESGNDWHMTMKDSKRWHITLSDRSCSYWFECDGGVVKSIKPKKAEFGSHPEKHKSLDEAPGNVSKWVKKNITSILAVNEHNQDDD
jgi:hypothetical protein